MGRSLVLVYVVCLLFFAYWIAKLVILFGFVVINSFLSTLKVFND